MADAKQFGDPGQAKIAENKLKGLPRLGEPIALAPTTPTATRPGMLDFGPGASDIMGPPK